MQNSCSQCEEDSGCPLELYHKKMKNHSKKKHSRKNSYNSSNSDNKSYLSITLDDGSDSDDFDTDSVISDLDRNDYYVEKKPHIKLPTNSLDQIRNFHKLSKEGDGNHFKDINKIELSRTLYEAILYPEKAKGFKFPAPFQTLTYSFQQKNSFYVKTNELGNAFIQITMGQYLDETQFKTGTSSTNPLGIPGSQNGTSTVGQSNVFISNHSSVNGTIPISNAGNVFAASNVNMVSSDLFNMVRAGPMGIQWDYTGRIDAVSGTLTAGINYTKVNTPSGVVAGSDPFGLYPDTQYSVLSALEGNYN